MPGDGTRTAITSARPATRCLDLTRLISRVGRGPDTGIDRVERAYLQRLLAETEPVFALIRTSLGYILLDRTGMVEITKRLDGEADWGKTDLIGLLTREATPARRRAQADLRRFALARCRTGRLARMLRRYLPRGCAYLNVGHSNLRDEVFAAWRAVPEARVAVLVHDTIPLDFPQHQRPGMAARFEARMRRVARHADLAIYNSAATRDDAERWFGSFGRCPDGVVAHLGVALPPPDPAQLPPELDLSKPYFVSVGTIEPRKRYDLLLDVWEALAAEMLPDDVPRLVIAGHRGWADPALFRRLDAASLRGRAIFERTGLSDAGVAALIAGSHGLLCPSEAEGFGLPPAEAALLGVPVICRNLAVYREILGDSPVYVDSDDVYSWAQSVRRLMNNKKARRFGDEQARSQAKVPTWDDHFNIVLKLT